MREDLSSRICSKLTRSTRLNRNRLKAEKLIDSRVLEQLIRVQKDAGCSRLHSRFLPSRNPLIQRLAKLEGGARAGFLYAPRESRHLVSSRIGLSLRPRILRKSALPRS